MDFKSLSVPAMVHDRTSSCVRQEISTLLRTFTASKSLTKGKLIHQRSIVLGLQNNAHITKYLLNFYLAFPLFDSAELVFFRSVDDCSDIYLYNALLAAYSKNRLYDKALQLFKRLKISAKPDSYSYPSILKACGGLGNARYGEMVQAHVLKSGYVSDVVISSSLVSLYAKCGRFGSAIMVFDEMPDKDVACWNTVISCYYQDGQPGKSLEVFDMMRNSGLDPDSVTYTLVFSACARVLDLERGRKIHEDLARCGFVLDQFVTAAIVDMYGKCGQLENAREVFEHIHERSVVAWNSMIGGYSLKGDSYSCLELFARMNMNGVRPTSSTLSSMLMACSRTANILHGKFIHGFVVRNNIDLDIFIGTSLIDLYFKCGKVEYAESAFKYVPKGSAVSWNVMISGYLAMGFYFKTLDLFHEMRALGIIPDAITFTSILSSCGQLSALDHGIEIHNLISDHGLQSNEIVMSTLLDMYAKCGAVKEAKVVFDQLKTKDIVSWTSMITAYGSHGHTMEALELFHVMQNSGSKLDHVTFLAVLSACSHGGLVDQGRHYFNQMVHEYKLIPKMEHYSCLIDLLGRAGNLQEAYKILEDMGDVKPDAALLGSLFSACSLHRNVELGEKVARLLFQMDPDDHSTHIVLANMYSSAGRWDDVRKVRTTMKERRMKKNPGCSWIEIERNIHQFFVDDDSHPEASRIREYLTSLSRHMGKKKYPSTHVSL